MNLVGAALGVFFVVSGSEASAGERTILVRESRKYPGCKVPAYVANPEKAIKNGEKWAMISGDCPTKGNFTPANLNAAGNEITMRGVTYIVEPGATRGHPK